MKASTTPDHRPGEPGRPPRPIRLIATAEDEKLRCDAWLAARLRDLSRSRIQALLKSGAITVDGRIVAAHDKVHAGQEAIVQPPAPRPMEDQPEAIPLSILHEDEDVLVIDKPPGLVVHPAAGHADGTLVNALLHHCQDLPGIGGERRPGIVHRLDKDTSGVMVIAKTEMAMARLIKQFSKGRVDKAYTAIVHGVPHPAAGTVETLIGRHPHDRKKMSVSTVSGRPAVTHYEAIEALGDFALLRVAIETGRTHQIRVHMAHIGHPVLGDAQYGTRRRSRQPTVPVPRQMLHATQLAFIHPQTRQRVEFEAPLPEDMLTVLAALRQEARSSHPGAAR